MDAQDVQDVTHGSSAAHSQLVNEIMLAIGNRPDVRLSKNPVGLAYTKNDTPIRYGVFGPGAADIIGIQRPGRFLAIEVKTGGATQRPNQRAFQRMVSVFGGIYILARSVEDVTRVLDPQPAPTSTIAQ